MELSGWVDDTRLSEWVIDATERIASTVSDFAADDPRWIGPYLPVVNPPVWELAHVAWFAEWLVLRRLHGHQPLLADVDERYDSANVGHRTRWQLTHPDPADVIEYLRRVGDSLTDVIENDRGLDSTKAYAAYAVMHHDAHYEALTYTGQTLGWGPLEPNAETGSGIDIGIGSGSDIAPAGTDESIFGDRPVSAGNYVVGASRRQPFVMDNEKWAHPVTLDRFEMAVAPVTVAEFSEFVDDGGYVDPRLWSPGGLDWLVAGKIEGPAYWRRGHHGWERRIGVEWHPIAETSTHPMIHVCWWEADAYSRWAARRLPSEAEWEVAATTGPDGKRQPWFPWGDDSRHPTEAALDGRTGGTVPVGAFPTGDGPWGHRQLIGNVWEWTATTFEPYPHFEPDAYRDNSEPWFSTRKVLRGGSWVTRNRYVRSTFRNYFTPDRRDIFAGFRTCAR